MDKERYLREKEKTADVLINIVEKYLVSRLAKTHCSPGILPRRPHMSGIRLSDRLDLRYGGSSG